MHDLLAGQEPGVRFWAIASSVVIGVLCLIAGGALLFTQKLVGEWDMETPRLFNVISRLGLGSVAGTWLLYMAALVGVLGYRRTNGGEFFAMLAFLAALVYLLFVVVACVLPFIHISPAIM